MKRFTLLSILLAATASIALAADPSTSGVHVPAGNVPANRALAQPIANLEVDSIPVEKVIEYLRTVSGANIIVNWKALEAAGVEREAPITLQVRNLTMRKALQLVLDQASPSTALTYDVDQNVISITTQDEADKIMITKVYIVDDLVMPDNGNITPPNLDLSQAGNSGGSGGSQSLFTNTQSTTALTNNGNAGSDQKGQELITLIRDIVRPTIWQENGGPATIRYFNGKLLVTAPRSVHEAIGGAVGSTTGSIRVGS